jgi:hypothetical protein
MNLDNVKTAFSLKEITEPKKLSYNEILNPYPKISIIMQINYEMLTTFLKQTEFSKEYMIIFKNKVIDLKSNPIIFLNLML